MGKLDGKVAVITGGTTGMALAGAKLFVDCCARLHGVEHAVRAALQTIDILGVENCKMVAKAAADAGAHVSAATLASAIRGQVSLLSLPKARTPVEGGRDSFGAQQAGSRPPQRARR